MLLPTPCPQKNKFFDKKWGTLEILLEKLLGGFNEKIYIFVTCLHTYRWNCLNLEGKT